VREWRSPPFEPRIDAGYLFGRGSSDDKGQLFTHVKAIESYLRSSGELPVNIRCVFEGEEEIGSPHLLAFIERHRDELTADVAVVSDMRMLGPDRPAITYSLRGALSLELELRGPAQDLHSGNFGGAIHNPLQALCDMVNTLHDRDGRVAIRGFYDRVRVPSAAERADMARTGPSDAQLLRDAGATVGWGEPGFTLYERITIRPCLTVNGIVGGYQGAGEKAVIPARATVKLNLRLVCDQSPDDVERLVREHVARHTPAAIETRVRTSIKARPALVPRDHAMMRVVAMAYRSGFGATPVFLRSGGTVPVVSTFQEALGIPTALMGFALPTDGMHAPNERFFLKNFARGTATSICALAGFGDMRRGHRAS
jgi:acetylornithine deacetylase/succinyl-diaminopimelate desuccinylase-like protein